MSSKIYTRTGDSGETSIFGGGRIKKHSVLVDAYGTLDELSSWLGVIRSHAVDDYELNSLLKDIQKDIYYIAGKMAGADEPDISESRVEFLESQIDKYDANLPELKAFIYPSGTKLSTFLHVARAVCRRAERKMSIIYDNEGRFHVELKYVNRLSDLLYVLARYVNHKAGLKDELVL